MTSNRYTRTGALVKADVTLTEAQFQDGVIELARTVGWRVAHFRPARTEKGWRTPVSADGAGFPDLVLTRPPELVVVELKAQRGKLSDKQREWLQALEQSGVEVHVWRPSQWPEIEARLLRARSGEIHWSGTRLAGEAA